MLKKLGNTALILSCLILSQNSVSAADSERKKKMLSGKLIRKQRPVPHPSCESLSIRSQQVNPSDEKTIEMKGCLKNA